MKANSKFTSLLFILFVSLTGYHPIYSQEALPDSTLQSAVVGRKLFHGQQRLANKGPSCITCHNVYDPREAISGGTYGLNLTDMYTTFGQEGIHSFISNSPFPVMNTAFKNHPITEEEVQQLTAYLQYVSVQGTAQTSFVASGLQFLWFGLGGLILILLVIWFAWRKKKSGSVNKHIYERQIQTI